MYVLAAFSSYMYVTCTWKKLPKQRSYKKFARNNVDEIDGKFLLLVRLVKPFKNFASLVPSNLFQHFLKKLLNTNIPKCQSLTEAYFANKFWAHSYKTFRHLFRPLLGQSNRAKNNLILCFVYGTLKYFLLRVYLGL